MFRRLVAFLKVLVRETRDDRLTGLSAEVGFWGVFSLFPALLLASGLLGALDALFGQAWASEVETRVIGGLSRLFTERGAGVIDAVRGLFHGDTGGLLATAALLAAWSVSSGFSTVIDALDVVYDVTARRGWVRQRLLAAALGLGSVVVLVVVLLMLVAGPLFGGGFSLAAWLGVDQAYAVAWELLRAPVAFAMLVAWATTLFRLAPNRRSTWRAELTGGLLTSVLSVLASLGFNLYLGLAAGGNQLLGLLGGGLLLLLWLYLMALALLMGAEVNAVRAQARSPGP